jgi:hypothetical protein
MKKGLSRIDGMLLNLKSRVKAVMSDKAGLGYVEQMLVILISVVLGALLLAGLYMLMKDTVLPTLTERIKGLFDYAG